MKPVPNLAPLFLLPLVIGGCYVEPAAAPSPAPAPRPALPIPPMKTEILGNSVQGRPLYLYRFGEGPVGTLIMAGIHGDESTTIDVAGNLVGMLRAGQVGPTFGAVAVIPVANPDGAAAGRRTNSRKVDVNRNFPAANWGKSRKGAFHGGPSAQSEPETVIIKNVVETLRPRQIISIHSITRGRQCNNYDGPAEALAKRMAKYNGYPVQPTIGYPTPGSFGSWAGIDLQIPVVTLELPRDLPADQAWEQNRDALLAAIRL